MLMAMHNIRFAENPKAEESEIQDFIDWAERSVSVWKQKPEPNVHVNASAFVRGSRINNMLC